MKKLMIAMVAVALATVANAAASYNYVAAGYVAKNGADTNPGESYGQAHYKCYAMTAETAQKVAGGASLAAVSQWIAAAGYRDADSALAADAQHVKFSEYDTVKSKYVFDTTAPSASESLADSIGVFLYQDEEQDIYAYTVMTRATDMGPTYENWFWFDVAKGSASTGWNDVSFVPEPTSGLLLLLGVAGLALKRKQK